MNNSQEVAISIKKIAKSKGFTIGQMLSDCGLSVNTLSSMQSGGYYPRIEAIAKIADYLDCSVDYLLGRTSEIKKTAAPDETAQQLLNEFYELNQNGRDKLLEEAIMMNRSGMYKIAKNSEFSAG